MRAQHFNLPPQSIYMCGHSLGPTPRAAVEYVTQTLTHWSHDAIKGWNAHDWIQLPHTIGSQIAPLMGALPEEVTVSDSTTVNLYKIIMSVLKLNASRSVILTSDDNFPADLYIGQGIVDFCPGVQLKTAPVDQIMEHLDERIAVLILTHVNYRDASVLPMEEITRKAHEHGILVIWDLCHSVGAVPVDLGRCQVDFAIGCTYKYLNGGPGAPAFTYVNKRHINHAKNPIYGWMGHARPFAFEKEYTPSPQSAFLGGTPYILSLKALEGALSVFEGLDTADLYQKNQRHSQYLITALTQLGLDVETPLHGERGGHVAVLHPEGYALSRALIDHGIACDYREPHLIRFCINALYLSQEDLTQAVDTLGRILDARAFLLPQYQHKQKVT